jgi:virulence-associated protein VapD
MSQYDSALQSQGVKTAATNPAQLEDAAQFGYKQAHADMEKQAEDAFQQGYDETIASVYKTAAEIHYAGQTVAAQLIQESAK